MSTIKRLNAGQIQNRIENLKYDLQKVGITILGYSYQPYLEGWSRRIYLDLEVLKKKWLCTVGFDKNNNLDLKFLIRHLLGDNYWTQSHSCFG